MSGPVRGPVLAELLARVEAETAQGGRAVSYEPLGWAWLELGARRRQERSEEGLGRAVEAVTATTRADPRLAEGRVLRFGGGDWAVVGIDAAPGRPGRSVLSLERGR